MPSPPHDIDVEREILAIEARLDAARETGDMAAFDQVLGQDFRTTSPTGVVTDRDQAMHDFASRTMAISRSVSGDIVVRPVGDVAIVTGVAALTARVRGIPINGAYTYTHVYTRRDGRWQVVAAHTSRRMPDWLFLIGVQVSRLLGQ